MSDSPINKTNLIHLAALLAPVFIIQGTHRMLGAQPPLAAQQQENPLDALALTYSAPKSSPEQTAALDRAALLRTFNPEHSPFYYAPTADPTIAYEPSFAASQSEFNPANYRVSSISGRGDAIFAVINSKVYAVGDEIEKGLFVQNIDPITRAVTIRPADGKPVALSLVDPLDD